MSGLQKQVEPADPRARAKLPDAIWRSDNSTSARLVPEVQVLAFSRRPCAWAERGGKLLARGAGDGGTGCQQAAGGGGGCGDRAIDGSKAIASDTGSGGAPTGQKGTKQTPGDG